MNGPGRGRYRRFFLLLAPVAFAAVVIPAAPSRAVEVKYPASDVAEGLKTIQGIAGDVVAAGTHTAKATMIAEGVNPIWTSIEDTIKANDKASYEALEGAIHALEEAAKAGDATKAGGASGAFTSAVNFYLAKFPDPSPAAGDKTAASAAPRERKAAADTATAERKAAETAPVAETPAAANAAEAGDAALARTGPMADGLAALAGAAFAIGGSAIIAGARRRPLGPPAT